MQIKRKKVGRGFSYLDTNGDRITDEAALARIKSLTIPPALTEVKICHLANGQILSAVISGNTIMFKPSEKTIYSSQILIE